MPAVWLHRLITPLFHGYEWLRVADLHSWRRNRALPWQDLQGDVPLPPASLRVKVAGTADLVSFLNGGRLAALTVTEALARQGQAAESLDALLDFGCGCGRVLRWFGRRPGLHGTDLHGDAVVWLRREMPWIAATANGLTPPLPFADDRFGAVYAFSVFTHLTEPLQDAWLTELVRILRPGGWLMLSTHGLPYRDRLNAAERQAFDQGSLVVRFEGGAGSNLCNAMHPPGYLERRFATQLTLVEHLPEGAQGNPRQDLYVFRK